MNQARIESNPAVMMVKPIIAGTRITVESIRERLAHGESMETILEAHPRLTLEDIQACLRIAADRERKVTVVAE